MQTVDDRLDYKTAIDRLWPALTNYEAAVCYLIVLGFTIEEITEHFEWGKYRIAEIFRNIRKRLNRRGITYEDLVG